MSENERPRNPAEALTPPGLGNPFALGDDSDSMISIDHQVYREQLPLAGRTVGEIRRIAGPRYDIGREASAFINGNQVGDEVVVQAGQAVRFMHISGEKGQVDFEELLQQSTNSLFSPPHIMRRIRRESRSSPRITVEGDKARVTTPEGRTTILDLESLLSHLTVGGAAAGQIRDFVWPDGVKATVCRGSHVVLVHQTPPAIHSLRWIDRHSTIRHGPGTIYRQVRIALPYLIVLIGFEPCGAGRLRVSNHNEAFFRTEPLRSLDDPIFYPALLNCSKFDDTVHKPLSWICTQHLVRTRVPLEAGTNEQLRVGLKDLMHCMLESGFNYSSEEHELSSWFTESRRVDPRVSTIERWEAATSKDPMFVHDVPWIPVKQSVGQVARRSLSLQAGNRPNGLTSRTLARVILRYGVEAPAEEAEAEA